MACHDLRCAIERFEANRRNDFLDVISADELVPQELELAVAVKFAQVHGLILGCRENEAVSVHHVHLVNGCRLAETIDQDKLVAVIFLAGCIESINTER